MSVERIGAHHASMGESPEQTGRRLGRALTLDEIRIPASRRSTAPPPLTDAQLEWFRTGSGLNAPQQHQPGRA